MLTWYNLSHFKKKKKELAIRKHPLCMGLWGSQQCIFLTDEWCERVQLSMGDTTPGMMMLGAIRRQIDQAMGHKTVSSILHDLWHHLLPPGSAFPRKTVLGVLKKKNWTSHGEKVCKGGSSVASASVPAVRFLLEFLSLTFLSDGLFVTWKRKMVKPLSFQVAFSHSVLVQQKKP